MSMFLPKESVSFDSQCHENKLSWYRMKENRMRGNDWSKNLPTSCGQELVLSLAAQMTILVPDGTASQ